MGIVLSERRLPVRPDLEQLRRQAEELLRDLRAGEPEALALSERHRPEALPPRSAELADAQLVLARSYGAATWARLVQACELAAALWRGDLRAVSATLDAHPALLHEDVLVRNSSWGPPLTYAANLGHDEMLRALHRRGARDLGSALVRASLQGKVESARLLHELAGRPPVEDGALEGPAYTLSLEGTALLLELGARVVDERGRPLAPVAVVLESDSRKPEAKHAILELYVERGLELPDSAPMAVHRGRIDLLRALCARDPALLTRRYTHAELYPPELGCHDEVLATQGTPLAGATLLHLCIDQDEHALARWLLDQGFPVDTPAAVDAAGFGGHTPLFATVVSQPAFWVNLAGCADEAPLTELLLARGAAPNARASLFKRLHPGYGEDPGQAYHDLTPRAWGERFHDQRFVSHGALRRIVAAGGTS